MGIEPQVMQIREAFQAAWQSGSRPNISQIISDLEGPERTAALRELLPLDVEYRRRAGESPRASDYLAQFPAHRDFLESLFSDTQSLVGQAPPETVLRPASKPAESVRSIEATRTSIRVKDDRDQLAPTQSFTPAADRSKTVVPLKEFMRSLTDSGLMAQDELDAFLGSLPQDSRPENGKQLAQELYRAKKLTRFQVQAVYQGKTRGLVVGNYVVLDKLGEGGMGQVYKARHKRMDRIVALKVLPAAATKSPDSVKRFQREVKAAAKLTHPNIVTAYDADEHRGVHFLVMEYVEGKDLAGLVREKGPLPVKQAVDCILQAAKGLEYAHSQGVVHRDIKPHNLLMDKRGTVKILDMGLARLEEQVAKSQEDDGLTRTGAVMGTLDYMSPEQAMDTKTADARADIYSLGCTLHFLLTGRPPYSGDSLAAKIVAHRTQPIPSLRAVREDVPEALDRIFGRMLAKTVSARQASMEELLHELEQSRFAIDVGGPLEIGLAPALREEPLELLDEETMTLADPAASSVDMTQRWLAPSVGPATASRTWLQEYRTLLIALGILVPATLILALGIMVTLRTKTGDLIVEVNEPGAKVEVLDSGGKVIVTGVSDKGPLTFSVDPGQHQIRVEKDGFIGYASQIDIESRGRKSVSARLERKPSVKGTLVLKGAEAGALVEVLDAGGKIEATYRTSGPELSIQLEAGPHRVRIEKDGAELLVQEVRVTASQTATLDTSPAFQAKKQAVAAQPMPQPEPQAKPAPEPEPQAKPMPTAASATDQDRTIGAAGSGVAGKEDADVGRDESWKLPAGAPPPAIAPFDAARAKRHQEVWAKYLGVPVEMTNSIGMRLVLIPPGELMMGSTEEDVDLLIREANEKSYESWYLGKIRNERPLHRVRITKPFFLSMTEVTQEEYLRVTGATPSFFSVTGEGKHHFLAASRGNGQIAEQYTKRLPVEQVTWEEAQKFCEKLTAMPEEQAAKRCYYLPTEAQWEYVCRAGTTTKWFFGDDERGMGEYAWFVKNSAERTHPVGSRKANTWGVFDMHGNVWEWCQDGYDADFYRTSLTDDPTGPHVDSYRTIRGGGWNHPAGYGRSASRINIEFDKRLLTVGLRVLLIVAK